MSNIKWYCIIGSSNTVFWHLNNFAFTRLLFVGCEFVNLNLQYYPIMMCCSTELLYWVIQQLRKHRVVHCLSLLILSLWCYVNVHFQWFNESSSCFEEFQVDLLTLIIIFLYIFSETQESSALYGGVIGGVIGVIIIVMIISGILLFMRKIGNIYAHLMERTSANKVYTLWRMMISVYPSHILGVMLC